MSDCYSEGGAVPKYCNIFLYFNYNGQMAILYLLILLSRHNNFAKIPDDSNKIPDNHILKYCQLIKGRNAKYVANCMQ